MKGLDRLLQKWRIGQVRPHVPPRARVLDVGSAGDAALFRQLPGIREYVGVDPEMGSSGRIAPNALLVRGRFPDALRSEEPFDVIAMLAMLEHVPPDEQPGLASGCVEYLRPGGKLVVTVPSPAVDPLLDVLHRLRLVDGMALEQHYGFDVSSTRKVFEAAGLELVVHRRFQLGLNNLFVFKKPDSESGTGPTRGRPTGFGMPTVVATLCLACLAAVYIGHGIQTIWKADGTDLHRRRIRATLRLAAPESL